MQDADDGCRVLAEIARQMQRYDPGMFAGQLVDPGAGIVNGGVLDENRLGKGKGGALCLPFTAQIIQRRDQRGKVIAASLDRHHDTDHHVLGRG